MQEAPTMNIRTVDETAPVGKVSSRASRTEGQRRSGAWQRWVRLSSMAVIVVSLVALMRLLPVERLVEVLTARGEELGFWGPLLFGAVYILAAVLFVPGSALTLGAGAVFGLGWGVVTVSLASTTAAALAFLIGRYIARDSVRQWASKSPKFAAIDRAIGEGGWKIIALLRLSPAVPFSLGNYLFGLTSIRFWPYVITSWLAMLPGTFLYVYLGYAGRAGLSAAAGATGGRSAGQWALLVVGLLATVAVTVYVTRIARRAIKEHTTMNENAAAPDEPTNRAGPPRPGGSPWGTVLLAAVAAILAAGTACTYAAPGFIRNFFGPPRVELAETYSARPDGPTFDHSAFNDVVRKYVSKEGGWVDYEGLARDHAKLDQYIASVARAPFDQMGRNQKLALLINAYNAFTLRLILDHYPLGSIKDIPASKRWDDKRWEIGGHTWSLSQIEHEQVRPHFREPRIHFALVCAAVGCPPLRNAAYSPDRLEKELEDQAIYVHTHERWFQLDRGRNVLRLTSLYDWYGGDFKQVAGSFLEYAAEYAPALREALDAGRKPRVEFLDYDWSLNSKSKTRLGEENQK